VDLLGGVLAQRARNGSENSSHVGSFLGSERRRLGRSASCGTVSTEPREIVTSL
jgi:hypothetical protein